MKHKTLVLALALLGVGQAHASICISTGGGCDSISAGSISVDRISVDSGSISISAGGDISISGSIIPQQPIAIPMLTPADSLGQTTLSAGVGGGLYYSVNNGGKTGNFSEAESNSDGALLSLDMARYGFGYDARAYAENGATHAYATTAYDNTNTNGYGGSSANATSTYSDWFVITGGAGWAYASMDASLDGMLAGGGAGSASVSFNVSYSPQLSSFCYWWSNCGYDASQYYQSVISENMSISGRRSRTSNDYLVGEFAFTYDKPFQLTTTLTVNASNGGTADFFETGILNGIDLPAGAKLTSASGLFVATNVPEPGTYALMLAGLGLVGFMSRRRKFRN